MSNVADFARLFRGRTDAYGTGKGQWIKRPVREYLYDNHLQGLGEGLGIAPLLDDGTVWFAAIDLDEPDFEAAHELQTFLSFGTTWIERSRSGNAHVWAFFESPIEAWIPRGIMREATKGIGKPTVEVFPKQDKLQPGMVGNYINLPYHGDTRPMLRRCIDQGHVTFEPYKLFDDGPRGWDCWVPKALEHLNDPATWRKRADMLLLSPPEHRTGEHVEFGTGKELHMCAEWIVANRDERPIAEGHRNVVYFNLAKQLSHYEGFGRDEVWELLCMVRDSADEQGTDHVEDAELRRILTNAERGEFTSTGCDDPLMQPYVHPDCPIAKGAA